MLSTPPNIFIYLSLLLRKTNFQFDQQIQLIDWILYCTDLSNFFSILSWTKTAIAPREIFLCYPIRLLFLVQKGKNKLAQQAKKTKLLKFVVVVAFFLCLLKITILMSVSRAQKDAHIHTHSLSNKTIFNELVFFLCSSLK